ncbi:MAG: endonuclease/exonuclease/phosphatase family protein [Bacteroidota bacterium]
MRKGVSKILRWVNISLVLLTLGAYLAPYIHPEKSWVVPFLGLGYPILFAANIGFIVFWAFFKKRFFILSLLCIIAGWSHVSSVLGTGFGSGSSDATNELKVMSYNVHFFNFYLHPGDKKEKTEKRVKEMDRIVNLILTEKPDILCLQETGSALEKDVLKKLETEIGLKHLHRVKHSQIKILSKYPLTGSGKLDFDETANTAIFTDVNFNGEKVRLYNLHLQSLKFAERDYETIALEDPESKRSWKGIRRVASKIWRSSIKRAEQAEIAAAHIASSPHPVVVTGDFNDTPLSYTYRKIKTGMKDNFKSKGSGLGTTYAGPIPLQRIDYILTDPGFQVLNHKIIRKGYSDHYPLVSTLKLVP